MLGFLWRLRLNNDWTEEKSTANHRSLKGAEDHQTVAPADVFLQSKESCGEKKAAGKYIILSILLLPYLRLESSLGSRSGSKPFSSEVFTAVHGALNGLEIRYIGIFVSLIHTTKNMF